MRQPCEGHVEPAEDERHVVTPVSTVLYRVTCGVAIVCMKQERLQMASRSEVFVWVFHKPNIHDGRLVRNRGRTDFEIKRPGIPGFNLLYCTYWTPSQ